MRILTLALLSLVACKSKTLSVSSLNSLNGMQAPKRLAAYKKNLPQVAFPELNVILRSDQTYWYDSSTVIPAYQDNNGIPVGPVGMRDNSSGHTIGLAQHLFKGEHWAFPFGHTAGTDASTNTVVANFLHLPTSQGQRVPVGYYIIRRNDEVTYRWIYPKGTILGEVIYIKSPTDELYVAEIRTRKKYGESWATNVFRPFPTAKHLIAAVKTLRPQYASNPSLASLVQHLENDSTLKPLKMEPRLANPPLGVNNRPRGQSATQAIEARLRQVFVGDGAIDVIPPIGDKKLVEELLTKTTFVSSYNLSWKKNSKLKTFAASTADKFSIVPDNYKAGLIEVNEASCKRCHEHAGNPLRMFDDFTTAYGLMWGNDGIFSFQPFETNRFYLDKPNSLGRRIKDFNNENRFIRKEFVDNSIIKQITRGNSGPYTESPRATLRD